MRPNLAVRTQLQIIQTQTSRLYRCCNPDSPIFAGSDRDLPGARPHRGLPGALHSVTSQVSGLL